MRTSKLGLISQKHLTKILFILNIVILGQTQAQDITLPISSENSAYTDDFFYNNARKYHTAAKPFFLQKTIVDSLIINRFTHNENNKFGKILSGNLVKKEFNNGSSLIVNPILGLYTEYSTKKDVNSSFRTDFGAQINYFASSKFTLYLNLRAAYTQMPGDTIYASLPHEGQYNSRNNNKYFFIPITGYANYKANEYINITLGRDKVFFGDGYRSMLLSDNSPAFPFFRIQVGNEVIKYTWLLSALSDIDSVGLSPSFDTKFMASHFLSLNIGKRLNFNFFETVIGNRRDSLRNNMGIDLNYLNPVVFYRPLEFSMGSPNNVILGLGFRWNIFANTHLYGQASLDEFKLSQAKEMGNWANKFGLQLGAKSYNLLPGLFLQAEYNWARPYTYSHEYTFQCYGNSYQPLAHPAGGNFSETLGILRYTKNRWLVSATLSYLEFGQDNNWKESWGHDIYKGYNQRVSDINIKTPQGYITQVTTAQLYIQWLINPNCFSALFFSMKAENYSGIQLSSRDKSNIQLQAGIRAKLY